MAARGSISAPKVPRSRSTRSSTRLRESHLLEERKIIFEMPVIRDLALTHFQNIRSDEIDRLATPGGPLEDSGEMTGKSQVRDDAVGDDDALYDDDPKVRHCGKKRLGCGGRARRTLGPPRRQRVVDETRREREREQTCTAIRPKTVEGIDRLQQRGATRRSTIRGDNQFLRARERERSGVVDLSCGRGYGCGKNERGGNEVTHGGSIPLLPVTR